MLDAKVLLDPLEKHFDLPAVFIKCADGQRRQVEVVAQEDQPFAAVGVLEAYTTQMFGVVLPGAEAIQCDGLVANQARVPVHSAGTDPVCAQVRFGAGDEETARPVQGMEPGKVDVAPAHDVDGPGFRDKQVERVDIAHLAVGNVDETRDAAWKPMR